jgi:hypothetical protein
MSNPSTSTVVDARNTAQAAADRWKAWDFNKVSSLLDRDDPRPQNQQEATDLLVAMFAALKVQSAFKDGTAIIVGCEDTWDACNELIGNAKYHADVLSKATAYTLPSSFSGSFAGLSFGAIISKLFFKGTAADRSKAVKSAALLVQQSRA